MCGIFGRVGVRLSDSEAATVVHRCAMLIRHRGPDGEASIVEDGVMIGATRLAVIDTHAGNQPFANRTGEILVVFNGEIYNHLDLRNRLAARGVHFRSSCDGEVLPHLYELYGVEFVKQLDGMFSLAIWDRPRRRLILATDRAGIKPLYWTTLPDGSLAFSSEIRVLPLLTGEPLGVDTAAVGEYLCFKAVYPPRTLYAGIKKFRGGEWLIWEDSRLERGLHTPRSLAAEMPATPDGLQRELVRTVETSLQADRALACIVSGGLDSSLVAALAARKHPGLQLFTVGYPNEPPEDERPYARLLAKNLDCPLTEVEVGPADVPTMLPDVVRQLEEPIQDPVTLPTAAVMAAVGRNYRVVLTGDGSDELFGGYSRFQPLALEGGNLSDTGWFAYETGLYVFRPEEVSPWLGIEVQPAPRPHSDALVSVMGWEMTGRLPAYHLVRVDKLSMAVSVEARVPFLRNGLIDLSLSLPATQLTDGREEKRALRAAARGIVPEPILNRRKQPFTFPVLRWLSGPLQGWARDLLLGPGAGVRNYLPATELDRLIRLMSTGNLDAAARVWSLLQLELLLSDYLPEIGRTARQRHPWEVRL